MDSPWQLQTVLSSNNSVDELQKRCTPFFLSGILISRPSWQGCFLAGLWRVAEWFGWAEERRELANILLISEQVFSSILTRTFQQDPKSIHPYLVLSYFPENISKIETCASAALHCSVQEWKEALRFAQKERCLAILDELMPAKDAAQALRDIAQKAHGHSVQYRQRHFLEEIVDVLPSMPSAFLWDCFDRVLHEGSSEQTSFEERSLSFLVDLVEKGVRIDQIRDRTIVPFSHSSEVIHFRDKRFSFSSVENSLLAPNGFLLPLWKARIREGKTLLKVIEGRSMDEDRRKVYLEPIEGLFKNLVHKEPQLLDRLCEAVRLWISLRLSFSPHPDDLFVSKRGELVTFEPVIATKKSYSVVEIERFLHSLHLSQRERKEVFGRVRFFDLFEVRKAEGIWRERGYCSERELFQAIEACGIEDRAFYEALLQLVESYPSEDERESYLEQAHKEGFFFIKAVEHM